MTSKTAAQGSDRSDRSDRIGEMETALHDATALRDLPRLAERLALLSTGEITALIGRLSPVRAAVLFRLLEKNSALAVFEKLNPATQRDLLVGLRDEEVSAIFSALDPEDRVELLDELPATVARRLISGLSLEEQRATGTILGYPTRSVGRGMTTRFIHSHAGWTVAETLAAVRAGSDEADTVYTIPVTDESRTVLGIVTLRDLVENDPAASVAEILVPAECVRADVDIEVAARVCIDLRLDALPVVDNETRLLGMFTLDDALRVLRDAESEDVARAGAAEPLRRPYLAAPILRITRSRVVWLLVLAVSALLTVQVLGVFEATLEQKVVLALFIPLLTGTGGNTGSQAATTVTRALAVGDVRTSDIGRVLFKELRVGAMLGLLLGSLGLVIATLVYDLSMGLVIGATLLLICTIAATVGGAMPLAAKAIRADPAVFSTPFITTFCDATGLIIYFTTAKVVLGI